MRKLILSSAIAVLLAPPAMACTTILVGNQASSDGSFIIARNEDYSATNAKHFLIHPHVEHQKGQFTSHANGFTYPLPATSLHYTSTADFDTNNQSMGEVGFNEAGVGMTATETIYNGQQVLKFDPYVEKTGITEDAIEDVILPRIKTAREGVELLGQIIEKQGAGEGFGVAFVDQDEVWYLETGSGHQWMATRLPVDSYLVSANQGRLAVYNPEDSANYLGSKTLISFAEKHGLYHPETGPFDFHKAYSQDLANDVLYNYPRVWTVQHLFNPGLNTEIKGGTAFPVFLKPEHKISVANVQAALRNHYQGTSHDPYTNENPKEAYRPISVFRTQESHVLQVRPNLPKAIGEVEYIAIGMPSLSVYVPYYQGIEHYLPGYDKGTDKASDDSVSWQYRKLQTLVMQNYNAYAPEVEKAYAEFEKNTAAQQVSMEKEYLKLYSSQPKQAQKVLQKFEDNTMQQALDLTHRLTNQVLTKMTHDTDMKYHFEGA
ncbi:C69 family dipeptidase [Pseudomonas lundensis]|uniref:C69 family dipeptidase n=1 Tax=Serratia proteamaculans TaxID=28151 RepID=UPI00298127E8|nr:C69 family dipeptidase [Serratia proteamaculans]MDW5500488.1 C69 family dipeptidase [Serratia proteamaculans]MDW5505554.1 C69 family dipeptidase [Pseudomonas lundensis]